MRLNSPGRSRNTRHKKCTPEEETRRKENIRRLREALDRFNGVTHASKKQTRGRSGPEGKIVHRDGAHFELKFPHRRNPEKFHVLDLEPVRPAL